MNLPRIIFVTDPICSWCWGTLPQIEKSREALEGKATFELMMGGLQIGAHRYITTYEENRLKRLWQEVTATTGQPFSGNLPDDFIYHSELACRSVEAARTLTGAEPWSYFHALQRAFYVDSQSPSEPDVLARVAVSVGMQEQPFRDLLEAPEVIQATRRQFETANFLAAHALPSLLLDKGDGPKLVCGGYVTTEYLLPEIEYRLAEDTA